MNGTMPSPADVVHKLKAVESTLVPVDGMRYFNMLYLEVTREVSMTAFEDPDSLKRLELNFVEMYLAAVGAPAVAPKCWRVLFESRLETAILPVQFALAGMNAHINHDLPQALAKTWVELGIDPRNDGPLRRDYDSMNSLLAGVEERTRDQFIPAEFKVLPEEMERLGDILAIWNIQAARAAAWANGAVLWTLREAGVVREAFVTTLDRYVGMSNRGILQRVKLPAQLTPA